MAYKDPHIVAQDLHEQKPRFQQRMTIESHSSFLTNKRIHDWLERASIAGQEARDSLFGVKQALIYYHCLETLYVSFMRPVLGAPVNYQNNRLVITLIEDLLQSRKELIEMYHGNKGKDRDKITNKGMDGFIWKCRELESTYIQSLQNLQFMYRTVKSDPRGLSAALTVFRHGGGGVLGTGKKAMNKSVNLPGANNTPDVGKDIEFDDIDVRFINDDPERSTED